MSAKSSTIGLVIPSLNQGKFLGQALENIFIQKNVSLRVALCDAGSTDQTLAIAKQYMHQFTFFRSHPDKGQACAINEGISRLGNTSYVGWLNADDVLLREGLGAMAQFLDHHPECIAVFGKAYVIDEKGEITGEYPTTPFCKRKFAVRCTICQPGSLIRRRAWEAVGGVDESFQTCIDYDLWWRLSKIGQIGYLEQFVACTRDHVQSKTRTLRMKVNEEAVSLLLRHRGMVPRNWCMANTLEALEDGRRLSIWERRWEATRRYVQINRWKALWPQNWLLLNRR